MASRVRCMATWPRPIGRMAGRARRGAPGQATLEFALFLPILLLIALVAVDVGRMSFDYIGLRAAAMEGARFGASRPQDTADIQQRVLDHFQPNPAPSGLTVAPVADAACSVAGSPDLGEVRVTVTRPFTPFSLAALQTLAPSTNWSFTVQTTAVARCMT